MHPSLDVEVVATRSKRARTSVDNGSSANGGKPTNGNKGADDGAEVVARELDVLNNRYQALLGILLDRLRQLAAMIQDPQLQVSMMRSLFKSGKLGVYWFRLGGRQWVGRRNSTRFRLLE